MDHQWPGGVGSERRSRDVAVNQKRTHGSVHRPGDQVPPLVEIDEVGVGHPDPVGGGVHELVPVELTGVPLAV